MGSRLVLGMSVVVSILAGIGSADATHQITRRVAKNTPTSITDIFSCDGNPISAQVTQQPANGSVSTFTRTEAVSAQKLKASRVGCEGKVVPILFVRYTPKRGFVGSDSFTVLWSSGSSKTYNVEVR